MSSGYCSANSRNLDDSFRVLDELELLKAQADLAFFNVVTRTREVATITTLSVLELTLSKAETTANQGAEKAKHATEASVAAVPTVTGPLAVDATSGLRGMLRTLGSIAWQGLRTVGAILGFGDQQAENAKQVLERQTELAIECSSQKYEILQRVKTIEQLCREEVAKRVDLYIQQENVQQAFGAYLSILAEGQRLGNGSFSRMIFRIASNPAATSSLGSNGIRLVNNS